MGKGETGDKYSLRYIGSESYSADPWSPEFALKFLDGKLRLLYEAAPMSFLLEQGDPSKEDPNSHSRVMDIPPVNVHQRVPIVLGSKEDVEDRWGFHFL
ncbi:Fructose-1,6-bisphosphatase, chloroplastic [Symbiodinium microadriaticum]|uniref:D-fructose-1,6-bisphosphate 1-phosphohydrolase n=1 Tax=Symbiodinium microadriaticum TaxID=2951 RepID=A0A1Q9F6T3_SYMMI|nr:Fructose-1,6-bisphosphatase, chloroplastic [Symbiodinium microadriaticum]